jgi:hypothetical protein
MKISLHQYHVRYVDEPKGIYSRPIPINGPSYELHFQGYRPHDGTDELQETIARLIELRRARDESPGIRRDVSIVFTPTEVTLINHTDV